MTPVTATAALGELLARLGATGGGAIELRGDELAGWPAEAVQALQARRVLAPSSPATSAVCDGCERACPMPVQVLTRPGHPPRAFIACDKTDDIGRVPVALLRLERWRASDASLADALAMLLGSTEATRLAGDAKAWRLGVAAGRTTRAAVLLRWQEGGAVLEVAGHVLPLDLALTIKDAALILDSKTLVRCVDAPAAGGGVPAESPDERRQRLKKRVAAEKSTRTKNFLEVVAAEEGLSTSRLKQLLATPKQAPDTWAAPLASLAGASPKKSARKR
jgi:hypothetical protein